MMYLLKHEICFCYTSKIIFIVALQGTIGSKFFFSQKKLKTKVYSKLH